MELKIFIQQTLEQIVEGVSNAQASISESGATVNPTKVRFTENGKNNYYNHAMPKDVEFDVGIISTSTDGSTEGIGVFLGSVSLGKKNMQENESVAVTKVKFSVPLVLPAGAPLSEDPKPINVRFPT